MSLLFAENLLRQYNKNLNTTDNKADDAERPEFRFFTESYLNKYDLLYNKYKNNKNFNVNMWHQAFKSGDQDSYLTFLEQNKDTELSSQFYDPMYYDYESMMLELYKPLADSANKVERKGQEWDPLTEKLVEKSLGKMSDQEYIQHQLNEIRMIRSEEIQLKLEQWRKEELGWWGQFGHDIAATLAEFGEGILTGLAGIVDVIASPFYATGAAIGGEDWLDAFVDYFGSKGLTAAEKNSVRAALDEYERTHTHFMDIEGNVTGIGKYVSGIANSIGMMIPAIVANALTGGTASLAWVGTATFYTAIFSGNMYENANDPYRAGSPSWLKITNATVNAAVEAVIEWGLGKILGGTIQNTAIGLKGGRVGASLAESASKEIGKGIGKMAGIKYLLKSAGQEGLEEFFQDFSTNLVDQFTDMLYEGYGNTGVTFQTLIDSFAIGALSSLFMSGGEIAVHGIGTSIKNKYLERTTGISGMADTYIEVDGKPQRVRGATKMYFNSIISQFNDAVESLNKKKIVNERTLALAQEVYGALEVMSQLYSSFSKERIINAEKLLNRIIKAEQADIDAYRKENRFSEGVSDDTIVKMIEGGPDKRLERQRTFAETVEGEFRAMIGESKLRAVDAERVREAVEKVKTELEEGKVTETTAILDIDGARRVLDPELEKLLGKLDGKINELHQDYDLIFTTDGHVAVEVDGMLFISEAWLENYETSEIYKFLAQTRVLKEIINDAKLQPLIKTLIEFDKGFTKQENVTAERAVMDLLFNPSVYQSFLLSHKGKNLMQFKDFIFRLHDLMKIIVTEKIDSDKRTKPQTKEKQKAYFNTIYEQIKENMRIPTLKAILNWNMNATLIGADSILTQADRDLIEQHKARKNLFKENRTIVSAYEDIVPDILREGHFTENERSLIEKGLTNKASEYDRLIARALLSEASRRMTSYDFELSAIKNDGKLALHALNDFLGGNFFNEISYNMLMSKIDSLLEYSMLNKKDIEFLQEVKEKTEGLTKENEKEIEKTLTYLKNNKDVLKAIFERVSLINVDGSKNVRSFVLPPEAFDGTRESVAAIQFKADKLNEFEKIYGIPAYWLLKGLTTGLTNKQIRQIHKDMQVLGVTDYASFVQRRLENLLGPDYIVALSYQIDSDDENKIKASNFNICYSIPADKILISNLFTMDKTTRNRQIQYNDKAFIDMFEEGKNRTSLNNFVKLKGFENWTVEKYVDFNDNNRGTTNGRDRIIRINLAYDNPVSTLIHEVNHAIQHKYHLPTGFSPKLAEVMPDFLKYVAEKYAPIVEYIARRTRKDSTDVSVIARAAYLLVQGELWAEHYEHNGKLMKGFTQASDYKGELYIVSPDGKEKFLVPYLDGVRERSEMLPPLKSKSEMIVPDHYIKNAAAREFDTIFRARQSLYENGYMHNKNIRNTYHTTLSKKSGTEIVQSIVNKTLPATTRVTTTINDIILAPETYLDREILNKIGKDLSEGKVFYFLKEYIEDTFESISIDRTENTHEYILVDDNAFDDLLSKPMLERANDKKSTHLAETMNGVYSLNNFYNMMKLMQLRIGSEIKVIVKPNIKSETHGDTIYISTTSKNGKLRTDSEIIDTLNHEFRHIMQKRSGLETGFTTDFVVTSDMLKDLKKRVPEIFDNWELRMLAELLGRKDIDAFIAQRFIYYLVGGEKNAYGIKASLLNVKPIYVTDEGGKLTIFMPWHNSNTGEGRYVTTRTDKGSGSLEVDENTNKKSTEKKGTKIPQVEKKRKYTKRTITLDPETGKKSTDYIYTNRRAFSKEKAKGTNLEYFTKVGERGQMDVDLQNFVIATTGNEHKLPPALVHSIKEGKLTKQTLYRWFRQTDSKNINQYTFDLLNKYMFKNDYIKNISELDSITKNDPSLYWATAIVLSQEGASLETLVKENSIDKLLSFLNSLEGTEWKKKIEKLQVKFDWYKTDEGTRHYALDEKISNYMRIFTMQWFDGTFAGAVYMANAFRKTIMAYQEELVKKAASLEAEKSGEKDNKSTTLLDNLADGTSRKTRDETNVSLNIEALYELDIGVSKENMTGELVRYKYLSLIKTLLNSTKLPDNMKESLYRMFDKRDGFEVIFNRMVNNQKALTKREHIMFKILKEIYPRYEKIREYVDKYQDSLDHMEAYEVSAKYAQIINAEMVGSSVSEEVLSPYKKDMQSSRVNIVANIKRRAQEILKSIEKGEVAFSQLPKNVQAMFELKTYDADGTQRKKHQFYELKPEVYSVGRGPMPLKTTEDYQGKIDYDPKKNMADPSQSQRHDVTRIAENAETLKLTLSAIRQIAKNKDKAVKEGIYQTKRLEKKLADTLNRRVEKKMRVETPFEVKTKRRTSDTPNNFNIHSDIAMPEVLRRILDISFEDMANTEVQFASRDIDGNLLNKETLGDKKFNSRVEHEISNWTSFYEANRAQLLALTRGDVLDIVEFFQVSNMTTEIGGPSNKLTAFEIFLLGYLVDATRRNFNNWDFSDAEKEIIEKLYEQKASAHGSGLNAVGQMLKVIDPFKRVTQKMLDDYNITEDELKPLIDATDRLQNATDLDTRKRLAGDLAKELDRIETLMATRDMREKGFGKNWFKKLKSARYTFMLSSPITWIRNLVSNIVVAGFNDASDVIGNLLIRKGYRESQWNLSKVQVSQEVKTFINDNIKNSELFDSLYESTSKYDDVRKKNIDMQKDLFVNMIVRSLEQKYAAQHRFDSKTANALGKFIIKMISDKRFIKHATEKYLGKILTIEIAKGNVDLNHGLSNRVLNLFAEAVILGNMDYMHKRSFFADAISKIRETSPIAYEVLTFWQPFLNSSFNWFTEMLKYSPIGLITSIINMTKLEKTINRIEERRAKGEVIQDSRAVEYLARRDVGKGVIGMVLTTLGLLLGLSGAIRIDEEDEKFYIYAGDIKIDITNVFGTSSILVGTSIAQIWVQNEEGISFDKVMRMVTGQLFEGFILNDLLARHRWDEGIWDFLLTEGESVLRSFVPQFMQILIRATNTEKLKYTSGFTGVWERWLNTFVPTQPFGARKINPYSGEVETKYALPFFGEFLKSGILGPKIFWSEVTDEELLAREYNVNKGELTGKLTINGKEYLLDKEKLNVKYGQLNNTTLAQLKSQRHNVEMPDGKYKVLSWNKMSDKQRANVINREMTKNADAAKIYIWTQEMGKRYYASDSLYQLLKKLGITKNVYRGDKGFVE